MTKIGGGFRDPSCSCIVTGRSGLAHTTIGDRVNGWNGISIAYLDHNLVSRLEAGEIPPFAARHTPARQPVDEHKTSPLLQHKPLMLLGTAWEAYDDTTMHGAQTYPLGTLPTVTLAAVVNDAYFLFFYIVVRFRCKDQPEKVRGTINIVFSRRGVCSCCGPASSA